MPDTLPEEDRQLKRRPGHCPFCDSLLNDEFTWTDDDQLSVWVDCPDCEWRAYLILEVTDPDAP